MSYQSIIRTMKVGFIDSNFSVPAHIPKHERLEYTLAYARKIGCDCIQVRYPFEEHTPETGAYYREMKETYGLEYDIHVMLPVFDINGPDGASIAIELRRRCQIIKGLGMDILRSGYGGL